MSLSVIELLNRGVQIIRDVIYHVRDNMDIINICHETVSMCDTKCYIENYNLHYDPSKVDSVNDLGVRLAGGKMQTCGPDL